MPDVAQGAMPTPAPEGQKPEGEKPEGVTTEPEQTKPETLTPAQLQALVADLKAQVSKVNRESAERRKKLEAYEAEEAKRKTAELSDVEKATRAAADAQSKYEALVAEYDGFRIRSAVEMAAARLGFRNPADAYLLADLAGVSLDEGAVKGVDEALKKLAKDRPYLLAQSDKEAPNIDAEKKGGGKKQIATETLKARYGI